jgi:hypothetical protein
MNWPYSTTDWRRDAISIDSSPSLVQQTDHLVHVALLVCLAQALGAGSEIAVRVHKRQLAAVPLFIRRPLARKGLPLDAQGMIAWPEIVPT